MQIGRLVFKDSPGALSISSSVSGHLSGKNGNLEFSRLFASCLRAAWSIRLFACSFAIAAAVQTNAVSAQEIAPVQAKPEWLRIVYQAYRDGKTDDLLTAGRGSDSAVTLTPADPLKPTPQELRRIALARQPDKAAGEGTFYAKVLGSEGRKVLPIAGFEYLAFAAAEDGSHSTGLLLQIPDTINWHKLCIVAVPASGSGRLYSAADVQIRGGWGLKRGCAVVYIDKSQGNGIHDLSQDNVLMIDGTYGSAASAGNLSLFTAPLSTQDKKTFLLDFPYRIAFKHAHSRENSDASWGVNVLQGIEFALWQLNEIKPNHAAGVSKENTRIVVYGESNGGGASLKAAEADTIGLIDGVVAVEPQIQPKALPDISILHAGKTWTGGGKSLLDYFTWAIIWQPCAVIAVPDAPMVNKVEFAANRCRSLHEKGLLQATLLADQAREALDKLHTYGWESGADTQIASHFLAAPAATASKYASAQGRFGVEDRICGYSIAWTDAEGLPAAIPLDQWASLWTRAQGGAPVGRLELINDNDPRGPHRDTDSLSASTHRQDYNLDGALCLRELVKGRSADSRRVQLGIDQIRATGDLRGIPTLIVHGRDDARVPVNFSSRPYLGLNDLTEGQGSALRYIEVTHAGHFGASAPFDALLIPLNFYAEQSMDLLWAYLDKRQPLPQSQVVHTVPRGGIPGNAPALSVENLPSISLTPSLGNQIRVAQGKVFVPL